jgi:hypothetical protein
MNGLDNAYYLNAMGEWSIPQDSRVGDLGEHATIVDYIDNKFTWSSILE